MSRGASTCRGEARQSRGEISRQIPKAKVIFARTQTLVELLPEPNITMEELDQVSEEVAKETVEYLTYLLEDELGDLFVRHTEMSESV